MCWCVQTNASTVHGTNYMKFPISRSSGPKQSHCYRRLLSEGISRDSSVGIETGYGLDGPGIESRWEARFSSPVQIGPEAHPASYRIGAGSFPGVKRPGRGADHPPPYIVEIKESVELYICSTSGPSWPVLG